MSSPDSLLRDLLQDLPHLRAQMYFKSSLTALSHAMEDLVLAGADAPLVIANFQQERFYRQEIRRYQQIAKRTDQVYVLAAPQSESGFAVTPDAYEAVPLAPGDDLAQEWHLVIVGKHYSACLVCREQVATIASVDQTRRFEGFWTFDRQVSTQAARLLLGRIAMYRPELATKIEQAWQRYGLTVETSERALIPTVQAIDTGIFGQRLITYLQAGQYKLLKAYRAIAAQEQRERLINAITVAIRNSLNPQAVLIATVQELGQTFDHCRCLLYRCRPTDQQTTLEYEFAHPDLPSLRGATWSLADNPLIQVALAQERAIAISDVAEAPNLQRDPILKAQIQCWQVRSWLLVPIRYRGTLLGMIELHYGGTEPYVWQEHDILLVEAIATQAGVALTQAQAYADLETLNCQLEALERSQSNLIAIVGHELRTPLSTIQICLESIATEPEMPPKFLQTMLDTALMDADRMGKLIQNFLTLSRLESGQAYRQLESIQLQEAIDLALSSFRTNSTQATLPSIRLEFPPELPTVRADGEGLVDVFTKLLENACKFTDPDGEIVVQARICASESDTDVRSVAENCGSLQDGSGDPCSICETARSPMLEVIIADTGRGIEPGKLKAIFDRFSQEEDFLRRTVGGVGLGLAICRQIIQSMGGQIWAESAGKNQGSRFHFTLPIELSVKHQNRSSLISS